MGRGVCLVDSAEETANEVSSVLEQRSLERERGRSAASFFVTDVPDRFIKVGRRFLGDKVDSAVRIER
jgi:glutamate racemase